MKNTSPARPDAAFAAKTIGISLLFAAAVLLPIGYLTHHLQTKQEFLAAAIATATIIGLALITWKKPALNPVISRILAGILATGLLFDVISGRAGKNDIFIAIILAAMISSVVMNKTGKRTHKSAK